MKLYRGIFILDEATRDLVYGPEERADIERHVELVAPPQTRGSIARNLRLLNDVDFVFSGWTPPPFDDEFFLHAPRLKAIFYAGGSASIAESGRRRGVVLTTSHVANSIPVAEFTVAAIIFSLKHAWQLAAKLRTDRRFVDRNGAPGAYRSTVGFVSAGMIARLALQRLTHYDLHCLAYDPYIDAASARQLGIEQAGLMEIFRRSDVVSVHAPLLPETEGFIGGEHFSAMKRGATFINTARGGLVRENELIEVACRRPDLQFVLDVTYPEPPAPESPLYELPNVFMTPHIAGSAGGECRRLGRWMVEELERYVAGQPLKWAIPSAAPRTPAISHRAAVPI